MNESQPPSRRKILIIRFSSIGDIVLTTPVIRAVKQQIPNVELHYLVKKSNEILLKSNPYVDAIHTYKGDTDSLVSELKAENFDYIIDLQHNFRSKKIIRKLDCPHRSFPKHNIKKMVLVRAKINFLPAVHIVDRYFKAAEELEVVNDGQGLDYFIPEEDIFDIEDLPAGFEDGYIAVAVGAAHATKRIPVEKIIESGNQLYKPMVLLGDKNDAKTAEIIVTQMNGKALNLCGKFNINTTASVVAQSDGVLTGDTGIMHIAAALGKPIASLWGNTVPELGMYPYTKPDAPKARIFEVNSLFCRPCSKLGFKKCPHRHFKCMNLISSYEVADWLNHLSE